MSQFVRLCVVAATLAISNAAWADLPRPPGWEPTCVLEKEQQSGGPCEQCRGWASPDPCQEALAKKGFTKRCDEGGAGSYVAVWCQSPKTAQPVASTSPIPPPTVAPSEGNRRSGGLCGVSTIGNDADAGFVLALVTAAIGIITMRRRKNAA